MAWAFALAAAVSSIAGSALNSNAATSAASTQSQAALQAAGMTQSNVNAIRQTLAPWVGQGQSSSALLNYLLGVPDATGGTNGLIGAGNVPGAPTLNDSLIAQQRPDLVSMYQSIQNNPTTFKNWGSPSSFDNFVQNWQQMYGQASGNDITKWQNAPAAPGAAAATEAGNASGLPAGYLTAGFNPTLSSIQNTPGYQFTLDQGLKATQNGYASQGLASSGTAQKGAANYAEGLAGDTYSMLYNQDLSTKQLILNALTGVSSLGENAAAGSGNALLSGTNSIANLLTGSAAAQAAGTVGSAGAISNGASGVSNSLLTYGILNNLPNNAGGSGSAPYSGPLSVNYGAFGQQQP